MMHLYESTVAWLHDNKNQGFWMVFFTVSFLTLFVVYLIATTFRMQLHIRRLNGDKRRLMEEKDLMRKGLKGLKGLEDNLPVPPPQA